LVNSTLQCPSKNVIPAPIFIGINSSRNPEGFVMTGFPPEFTPYLIRGGSYKFGMIRRLAFPMKEIEFNIGKYIAQEYQRYIPRYRVDFLSHPFRRGEGKVFNSGI
jgi:hypothetical protein